MLSVPPAGPGMIHSHIAVDVEFPLHFQLNGERTDRPIDVFHTHNLLEIGLCLTGAGIFHVGGKVLPFQAGDVSVLTPLEWHRSQSARGTICTWAWFFFDPARLLVPAFTRTLPYAPEDFAGPGFANVMRGADHPELVVLLQELVREGHAKADGYRDNMRALLLMLLQRLRRRFTVKPAAPPAAATRETPSRVLPALDAMARRYHESLGINELARQCGMSVRTFQLHFRRAMGQTPQSYLIQCRVQAAIALLRTSELSVTDLAFECGFGSLSSFNRAFRTHTGRKPSAFRKGEAP